MSATRARKAGVGGACHAARVFSFAFACGLAGLTSAEVLFPAPLHITREVSAPLSKQSTVVDEYCHGNRVVSISGRRTAIADHAKGEVTVIDFSAGTYSVTKFSDVARLNERQSTTRLMAAGEGNEWRVERRGGRVVASRPGEVIEAERKKDSIRQVVRVTADRELRLSRAATEALLGTGYPNRPDETGDVVLAALRSPDRAIASNTSAPAEYFLPLEYGVVFEVEGERMETKNIVVRIGSELPPPDLLAIPRGAQLVDSDAVAARKKLEELDRPVRPTP